MNRPAKKARVSGERSQATATNRGPVMAVTKQCRGAPARLPWLRAVVGVALGAADAAPDGAATSAAALPRAAELAAKSAAAQCVAAVLFDTRGRLTILGGRDGMPVSLASIPAASVARFLPCRPHFVVVPHRDQPCAPHVDNGKYGGAFAPPYQPARAAVGGGVYAVLCESTMAVEVRHVATHHVAARLDLRALELATAMQLALFDGALLGSGGSSGSDGSGFVTLVLAGDQPTRGRGRAVAVQLRRQEDPQMGQWQYAVHAPLDYPHATLLGVAVVQPRGPAPDAVVVASTASGSVVAFGGAAPRCSVKMGAPAAMCSVLEDGRPGACFAVVDTAPSQRCVAVLRVDVDAAGRCFMEILWSLNADAVHRPVYVTCTGAGELIVRAKSGRMHVFHSRRRDEMTCETLSTMFASSDARELVVAGDCWLLQVLRAGVRTMVLTQ